VTLSPPTPTATRQPTPTPTDDLEYHITFAKYRDDSLFLINQSTVDLPLAFIRLGSGDRQLSGEAWKIDLLKPGECVSVWKTEGNPQAPTGIECEPVGERLEHSGGGKFWTSEFRVYFRDNLVRVCEKNRAICEVDFLRSLSANDDDD